MNMKEKLNCLRFAFGLSRQYSGALALLCLLTAFFAAASPLAGVALSAELIEEFTDGVDEKRLLILSVCLIVLPCVFSFAEKLSRRAFTNRCELLHSYEGRVFEQHISGSDFESLDDADFRDAVRTYRVICENNYGIFYNMWQFILTCTEGLFSSVLSIILIFPAAAACFTPSGDSFISSWKANALLIFAVIVLGAVLAAVGNRSSNETNKIFESYNATFAKFKYWFEFPSHYKNGKDIRIYSAEKLIADKHRAYLGEWIALSRKSTFIQVKYYCILISLQAVLMGLFYLYTGFKAADGAFSIGSFALFLGASLKIADGIGKIGTVSALFGISAGHISCLKKIVETPKRRATGTLPVEKRDDNRYDIEFKNVSFRYPGSKDFALKNVSCRLNIGRHVAVVGKNGSGKTTFIKLLCRLYDVTDGEITLNGINIKKYNYEEYMSLFSVVFQDFQLFSVPLSQNITTSLEYDEKKLFDCLEKAGAAERVRELPLRENSVIYKDFDDAGIEISGGEAQKIALSRALYKDAPFVILDEPTAALDPISEFEIYSRFNGFVGEKTAVYISHRLSSCRFCDEVYVFDGGRLIESGSHDELIERGGMYSALWNAQAKYYTEQKSEIGFNS